MSTNERFWPLALGSVGVVFGDIGTSPLYAFREALGQAGTIRAEAVMGVVSLALWALILVVTVKYVLFLMRADNRGEGGVLSLAALAEAAVGRRTPLILGLSVIGAALFYGDALITPAISVLSAIEGLRTVPSLASRITEGVVVAASLAVLAGLFLVQSRGTGKVGRWFGPICLVWFLAIAGFGLPHIIAQPGILAALGPQHAIGFLSSHGMIGLFVLGSVFLTVTGAEALFADMGHFGRWPIQAAWLFLVLPALAVNYLGQGAFVLDRLAAGPVVTADWFFQMIPVVARAPMVILATMATVIASQAVITGAYSLTNQAMQLGYLPRLTVRRTSETQAGEIYIPQVTLLLAVGVILLVAIFKTSSALAHAYGLAVTGTMVVTTLLAFIVATRKWRWPWLLAAAVIGPMLAIDTVFLGANALKLLSGGFVPLLIGAVLVFVMLTWSRGSQLIRRKSRDDLPDLATAATSLAGRSTHRAAGTAVFLSADPDRVPGALLHNLKHNRVLHERNLIVSIRTAAEPRVTEAERAQVRRITDDFVGVILTYGFMERPNVPRALARLKPCGVATDPMTTSYFIGRRTIVHARKSLLPAGMDSLYIWLNRNAADPMDFFQIPPGRVVELGTQVSV
ncbi:KUP system potassium uptake protein [Caulobacter ginsengisoli]|uniref:Probable potassium transport system protein Kup n=1 Tax=Caulobacter ginsengisoli TaxID=400775 RepID=A0ABU0IU52_9CAUL|nr:potassium transporter Kup [Caulobacter ginsengisoli]MDQ0465530.1 KUP system potassium uptake protein [Caulobacter ginsengisoli]